MVLVAVYTSAQLPLRLPSILSDHAVLQQNTKVKVWGWGPGSMKVAIVCSWNKTDTVFAAIGADCDWEATINTPVAGGSHSIAFICGKQKITIEDIVLGEVWLCSGQSNMEYNMKWGVADAGDALSNCKNNEIRFFKVGQSYDKYPQTNCTGAWEVCDENSLSTFSAVGYFFGRRLNDQLNVPVGLIGSYWGGTCIQAWMPAEAFNKNQELRKTTENIEPYGWAPKGATILYNAMIHPITPYRIAGTIWYQGEANVASESNLYNQLFTGFIEGWRNAFQNNFPVYFVQIAPCNYYDGIKAAYLREQQESGLKLSRTGMISVADLVDDVTNIHPNKKRAVGERLSNLALKEQYGKGELQPYSPHFDRMTVKGNKVFISVISLAKLSSNGQKITNFQLAGADQRFYPASASIEKDGSILVTSPNIKTPEAVRYCFLNEAIPNLFDSNKLPLLPFRTDNWPVRTITGTP